MACLSLPLPAKAKALTILFLFTYLPTPLASFSHLRIWDESISSKPPPIFASSTEAVNLLSSYVFSFP